jgi:hypothetical protein
VTEYNWKSAISGNWNTGKDWSPTGGPALSSISFGTFDVLYSKDSALFATGSNKAYTITGAALAKSLTVSHDTVNFANFNFSDYDYQGTPPTMTVDNGGDVTVGAGSDISLADSIYDAPYSSIDGTLSVKHAQLTVHGIIAAEPDIANGGVVTVSGSAAQLVSFTNYRFGFTEYGVIAKGGTLNVANGGSVTGGFKSVDGAINLTGENTSIAGATVNADGSINGANGATIANTIVLNGQSLLSNDGTITATSGLFTIAGGFSGAGTLAIDKGATLQLGGDSSNGVNFLNRANLVLDKGVAETGFMQSFGTGDTIDSVGLTASSLSIVADGANTLLSLYEGASIAEQLTFKGHYAPADFYAKADASGNGTLVAFEAHHLMSPIPVS